MGRADLDERAAQLRAVGEPFVRARVVLAHRPTSAKPGDEAIVHADGSIEGFVGGTCAETTVRTQSLRLLTVTSSTAGPEPLLLRITPDAAPDSAAATENGTLTVHNPCLSGGALEIFLDPVVPPPLVAVHGDGPLAAAIAAVTEAAGYRCAPADSMVGVDAVVVASHGRDEVAALCGALDADVPYIGLIASRRRGAAVLAEVAADRPDLATALGRIDTPAGLDLGARTAGEIAVSILAAIIATRPRPEPAEPGTAVDPVCGMTVATVEASLHTEFNGRTVWFCGPGCLRTFQSDPAVSSGGLARSPDVSTGGLTRSPDVSTGGLARSPGSVP